MRERQRDLDRAALDRHGLDGRAPPGVGVRSEQPQRDVRVGVADDDGRLDQAAVVELDALARPDRGHGHAGGDHRARLDRGVVHEERHHPHAALDEAPRPGERGVDAAAGVVQVDRGGPGVERRRAGADHALPHERAAQPRVVEVAAQQLGLRPLEEQAERVGVVAHAVGQLVAGRRVADPGIALAGGPDGVDDAAQQLRQRAVPVDVARGEARHLVQAALLVLPQLHARCRPRTARRARRPQASTGTRGRRSPSSAITSGCSRPAR